MKFERIYMASGTNKKADNTDYVDYYKAENGAVIQIVETINPVYRFYKVLNGVDEMRRKPNPLVENYHMCFERLRDAKDYVERMEVAR